MRLSDYDKPAVNLIMMNMKLLSDYQTNIS